MVYLFSLYTRGINFAQTNHLGKMCGAGNVWGTTWEPLGTLTGTDREHDEGKKQKILPPLPTKKITGTLMSAC